MSRPNRRAAGPSAVRRAVRTMGDSAFVVEASDSAAARTLATTIREEGWESVRDVVGGIRSVLVVMDQPVAAPDAVIRRLEARRDEQERRRAGGTPDHPGPSTTLVVPTVFDGPDLDEVASMVGTDADGIVAELTGSELFVEAVGFSPGFAYLGGLSPALRSVPRRSSPRPKVASGSVGMAAGFAAIYPRASPGGWQILGWTGERLFDPGAAPYAVLRPGDHVRFVPVPSGAGAGLEAVALDPRPPIGAATGSTQSVVIEDPGTFTTLQDSGRAGFAHLGVPQSGPADPVSHGLANELVGNEPTAAALEATLRGPTLVFGGSTYVAAVGGRPVLEVDGRSVGPDHVVPVAPGQCVRLVATTAGARSYLAVAGAFRVPETMGSCSTDTLGGIGPPPLQRGDELGVGAPNARPADHLQWSGLVVADPRPEQPGTFTLRVLVGPDLGWFAADLPAQLEASALVVQGSSDRVGVRLAPLDGAGIDRVAGELESQGMVTGAVQVLPTGHPVVLGPDHATLGGYPVAAVVIGADRHLLGQCRPGDQVRFEVVSVDQAIGAYRALRAALARTVAGRYPVVSA